MTNTNNSEPERNENPPTVSEVIARIRDVWGDKTDFEELGWPYVAFVIQQDINDMENDNWDEDECVEELGDIIVNSMRMLDEKGYDPLHVVMNRLENHEQKNPDELIEQYTHLYHANTNTGER